MKIEKKSYYYYNDKPYTNKEDVLANVIRDNIYLLMNGMANDYYSIVNKLCTNKDFRNKFKDCLINMEDLEFDE